MNNKTNKQTRDSDALIIMTYIGLCNKWYNIPILNWV